MPRFGSAYFQYIWLFSLSSPGDLAASAVRLINRSHQQEVSRPIRPGELDQGQAGVRLHVNTEPCLPLGIMDKEKRQIDIAR